MSEAGTRKNYSRVEEDVLVELVEQVKAVVHSKETNGAAWLEKEAAWTELAGKFSAKTGSSRPWKSLREKFESMRRRSKEELARLKCEMFRTGGGPPPTTELSPMAGRILAMMGAGAEGIGKCPDSDHHEDVFATTSFIDSDCEVVSEENPSVGIVDGDEPTTPALGNRAKVFAYGDDKPCTSREAALQAPTTGTETVELATPSSWAKYKPSMLRRPTSTKLRTPLRRPPSTSTKEPQRDFYLEENVRCREMHQISMERRRLQIEVLQLQAKIEKARLEDMENEKKK